MARRTKAEAEQTREAILGAAGSLFAKQGVAVTSLDDVAKAAGVTRGAVYWHFKDKAAMFEALYRRAKQPLEEYMAKALATGDPVQGLRDSCLYALRHMTTDPHASRIFQMMNFRCELAAADGNRVDWHEKGRKNALDSFERAFRRAKQQGRLQASVSPKIAALALLAYTGGLLKEHSHCPDSVNLKRNAPKLVDMFFTGLLSG